MFNIDTNLQEAINAEGLSYENQELLTKLLYEYSKHKRNNEIKKEYYKDNHKVDNIGIAVPPQFEQYLNTSVGWAAKSVDMLAQRSIFDGFVIEGKQNNELDKILIENDFKLSYEMAVPSELIHGCGFWTVTKGATKRDVPIIRYYNAENAAALWDYDKRRISAGFVIADYEYTTNGETVPSKIVLHKVNEVIEIYNRDGKWIANSPLPHIADRPLMEAMSFSPSATRPFGKSRISKAVMGIIDEMQREILRAALHSEMYSTPIRILLGVEKEKVKNPLALYFSKIWTIEKDGEGNLPKIEQLTQGSMTPHIDVMRNLASRMAAESSLPVNSLGIIHDNPASAEALRASLEDLCVLAESLNRSNKRSLRNVAKLCMAVSQNKAISQLSDEEKAVSVCFKNPHTPSIASQTDAMMKQASITPWLQYLGIYWKALGYNDEERAMIMAGRKQAESEMFIRQNVPSIQNAKDLFPNTKPTMSLEEQRANEDKGKIV